MNVRRSLSTASVAGAAVLGLVTLSACGGSSTADGKNKDGKLDVVTSFYPMQFLAERIGGEHVAVSTLTKPGAEPHDVDLTARQTAELQDAGLILYLPGVQPAVDDAIKQADVRHTVDAAALTTLESHGAGADGHDHGGEHADEHGTDEHGHEAEGDSATGDPHIWLDPVKYAEVARGVGDSLAKADPDHAADYRKNAADLAKQLDALHAKFEEGLKNSDTRTFITTHSAFGYLAERYGLDQEGIAGLDPESEPSPARIKELQDVARRDGVTTVFFETLASDKTAKTLAKDTGLKTDVLDPLEGITDKSAGADYFEVMEANLAALQKALGAK
ncbi:zinc ABC transporter substrate-binding protein [Streptomyces sp. MUM 203J]|uniref:metal ABC transporter substrate-binding protein n=1 Tax=Streptomyces sp. MUM 203J TaxID=2791990 RepID=UPI001F0379D9|nr:metal ABC transporter substrate-binding protein [Streptomyces sp. MUM 203J]MCH0540642.1 zinc ABC transporter substrate-binding protein [Streptomyces sp. MUM 203J]